LKAESEVVETILSASLSSQVQVGHCC